MERIAVLGAGSWGTALSITLANKGHSVRLWSRDEENIKKINSERENKKYLKGCHIPENIMASSNIEYVLDNPNLVVVSVPSHAVREVIRKIAPYLNDVVIVNTAKGFEPETKKRLSVAIKEELPDQMRENVVVLSGPSHAEEVGLGMPTTVVSASENREAAEYVQDVFISYSFRVYTNPDILGVELAGALKNVIALAAGVSDGLGFGDNTKAALMTRGIAEIARLGVAMGANTMTFAGLAGIGDLIVTCTSMHSRNRRAGIQLGEGKELSDVLGHMGMVVEGVKTTKVAYRLSQEYNVEMPITEQVYKVLFEEESPKQGVSNLMGRVKTKEVEEVAQHHSDWKVK